MFPEVGSTKVVLPGVMSPRFSASVIMERAIRSLTELAGLEDSSLATISQLSVTTLLSLTRGVFPMRPRTFSAILGFSKRVVEVDVDEMVVGEVLEGENAIAWLARPAAAMNRVEVLNFILVSLGV